MSSEAPAATAPADSGEGGQAEAGADESTATYEPVVTLDEVEVTTGEEDEDVIFKMRSKLFRFCESLLDVGTGNKQWNERGIGDARLLKHKESGKIRLLMRHEKTLKIVLNHLVSPEIDMVPMTGSDKAWTWHAKR